jgi:hypothetical protein
MRRLVTGWCPRLCGEYVPRDAPELYSVCECRHPFAVERGGAQWSVQCSFLNRQQRLSPIYSADQPGRVAGLFAQSPFAADQTAA